ncbi:MAG: ArnT family glycosyltransferase, partial [Chthoniobacterales bacterium]
MTNFGMIEKGRLIEIEALYVSLGGLAVICWLSWWQTKRSKWLTWLVPWIFLGLGLLAKGPPHLFFFYAVVVAVLYRDGQLRSLWNVQHLLGIILMLSIFAAWAIPCLIATQQANVAHIWSRQFSGRLAGEDFHFSGWIMNIPRGLGYFLPWIFGLVLLKQAKEERALAWGIGISFLFVSLLPGSLPRYTMPLLVPATWLVAKLLNGELRFPLRVAAIACVAMLIYAFALTPVLQRREKVKNIAAQINAALAPAEPLYAIDPDYQPFLFYVRDPIVYLNRADELPANARFILVQGGAEDSVKSRNQPVQSIHHFRDYRNKEVVLFELAAGG